MADAPGHLDENGRPCTRHDPAKSDVLLALALLGSRSQGFNHDLASKLQGLVMALEELDELAAKRGDDELRRTAAEASSAAQEVAELLAANRALSRTTSRSSEPLRELLQRAGERSGVVLVGELPEVEVAVVAPVAIQALALVLDVAAGPGRGGRLATTCRRTGQTLELALAVVKPAPPLAGEHLALASETLHHDGIELRCSGDRIVLRMPVE
jgi:hypothetical protein